MRRIIAIFVVAAVAGAVYIFGFDMYYCEKDYQCDWASGACVNVKYANGEGMFYDTGCFCDLEARRCHAYSWFYPYSPYNGCFELVDINNATDDVDQEYITLRNACDEAINMDGWIAGDGYGCNVMYLSNVTYAFSDFILPSGASFTLHTGCGTETGTELYRCLEIPAFESRGTTSVFQLCDDNPRTAFWAQV